MLLLTKKLSAEEAVRALEAVVAVSALPNKLPVIPLDTISEPVIWVFVFTINPLLGEIDAVTEPLAIWDKFKPTIPEAGTSVRPEPLPWNEPLNEPLAPCVTINEPVIWEFVFTLNPKSGEIDAVTDPLPIWFNCKPTIPEAGTFVNPEPLPWNEPLNDPLAPVEIVNEPLILWLPLNWFEPVVA